MKRLREWAWRYIPGLHPGMEWFVSWADGQPCRELESHLAKCRSCTLNAQRLLAAVGAAQSGDEAGKNFAPLLIDTFSNLQLQMQAWRSLGGFTRSRRSIDKCVRYSCLSEALEFYFGKEVARRIEHCALWNAAGIPMTAVTKPLFNAFLGRRAADALAYQIDSRSV